MQKQKESLTPKIYLALADARALYDSAKAYAPFQVRSILGVPFQSHWAWKHRRHLKQVALVKLEAARRDLNTLIKKLRKELQ